MNREIVAFFQALAETWRLQETIRLNIIHSVGFRSAALFKLIDSKGRGAIELRDLQEYLVLVGLTPSHGEIFTIFKELDVNKKGYISASDFDQYFSVSREKYHGTRFKFGEIDLVKKFFCQVIDGYRRLEGIRQRVAQMDPESLFWEIDQRQTGEISFKALASLLKEGGVDAPTIQDLISFFTQKKENSLKLEFYLNILEPFGETGINEQRESSEVLKRIYDETSTLNLDEFFKAKMSENKARRQFIETHERSRKDLMSGIMQRKNSPQLDFTIPANTALLTNSVSVPSLRLESNIRKVTSNAETLIPSTNPPSMVYNKVRLNDQNLVDRSHLTLLKQSMNKDFSYNNTVDEFSFNNKNTNDLSLLLQQQQIQLEHQRSRRIQLEGEMIEFKKQIHHTTLANQSRLLYQPFNKPHPTIDYLNYSQKAGPVFEGNCLRPQSACRKSRREVGKIEHRGLWTRELKGGVKESLEDELRRSRLDREFMRYKLNKDRSQTKMLWR